MSGSAPPPIHMAPGAPGGSVALSATVSMSTTAMGVVPSGRDTQQSPAPMGLMAGKMGLDGNSAAFDMKSLGKHIEAVSLFRLI